MWIAVTKRFSEFNDNIVLTDSQIDDGDSKCRGITSALNSKYWSSDSEDVHKLVVGSWGKSTAVRPPYDVDMFFVLPNTEYFRVDALGGNKQSTLLQEVKTALEPFYPQTTMRGDGQVVQVKFNTLMIEVVPAFELDDTHYRICDTNDGGSWKDVDPVGEISRLNQSNTASSYNTKKLVRMFKIWRDECGVPLKSYVLETLTADFLNTSKWANCSYFYYDWLVRDFFEYLIGLSNTYIWTLDGHLHWLDDSWKSRAESAWDRARKACDFETIDLVDAAGEEWQKIFGYWIAKSP
ncbi:SMODS domain-containing nucleotidyltransferase [Mesorhizobium sp. BE184]|uniref:SMODS domain-containing nucleotidyltransferase n=1 Tax=Mesorhizobium sp. BE184 TaxID=2817714 RepID=UPI0028610177|nr:hypothetical protein [Mesorhizobium sp. BE184]MDR7032496.1 hypothetical protein [Mesorhizobium sp. BE184]